MRPDTFTKGYGMTTEAKKGRRIGYIRVSTVEQNTERQLDGIAIDIPVEEKASGKDTNRPKLESLMQILDKGDTLVVHSMDRLARNVDDLRRIVNQLTGRGVAVEFVKEKLTFTGDDTCAAKLILTMLGAVAEFERSLIKERQAEGIAIAKRKGVYKGGKPKLSTEQVKALLAKDKAQGGKGRATLAREYGISRETLYSYLRNENQNEETSISP